MSEHFGITGKVRFYHLPYDELGSMCFCQYCKRTIGRMTINLHEGLMGGWIEVRCDKCKRTVWTAEFAVEPKEMTLTKLDKKCFICKKPCGDHNCNCMISSSRFKGTKYFCSRKCVNRFEKEREKHA